MSNCLKCSSKPFCNLCFRLLLQNFMLDTNIFGIDVGRNLHNARNETLLLLYQPSLIFNKALYDVRDPEARQYMQLYLEYLGNVITNSYFQV